jgi:hypothetical protein
MRRLATVVVVAGLATAGLLVGVIIQGGETRVTVITVGAKVPTVAIFPSDRPAQRVDLNYLRLFETGHTLATAAEPACLRYRRVGESWARRASYLARSSRGAGASKATAMRWYASVTWVSQDEAGDYTRAISRISRSRVSQATAGRVKRGALVEAFTADAIAYCRLVAEHATTLGRLERVDVRIRHILSLRHDASGLADGLAQ